MKSQNIMATCVLVLANFVIMIIKLKLIPFPRLIMIPFYKQ